LGSVSSVLRQEISCEERLRNDVFCVEWDVKPQLNHLWKAGIAAVSNWCRDPTSSVHWHGRSRIRVCDPATSQSTDTLFIKDGIETRSTIYSYALLGLHTDSTA